MHGKHAPVPTCKIILNVYFTSCILYIRVIGLARHLGLDCRLLCSFMTDVPAKNIPANLCIVVPDTGLAIDFPPPRALHTITACDSVNFTACHTIYTASTEASPLKELTLTGKVQPLRRNYAESQFIFLYNFKINS